jgi:hypothetical protein
VSDALKLWTNEPCDRCGCDRTAFPLLCARQLCGGCAAYEQGAKEAAALAVVPPPHPLVALLTEALAVTSLAQPPSSAAVSGVEVVLEWDGLEERTLSVQDGTYRFDGFAAHTHKSTTDPAEARAWLASALEVSRG